MKKLGILIFLVIFLISLVSAYSYPYNVRIRPVHPEAGDTLTCTANTASKGADSSDFTFYWYLNGGSKSKKTENGWHGSFSTDAYSTFSGAKAGDSVECIVLTAGGGTAGADTVNVLGGSAPIENSFSVDVEPKDPNEHQDLTCTLTPGSNVEFDSSDYTFYWYINDAEKSIKTENGWHGDFSEAYSTLTEGYSNGDTVECLVRHSDSGAEVGTPYRLQIVNLAPTIQSLPMMNVTENQSISFTINASDYDEDALTYTIVSVTPLVARANTPTTRKNINGNVFTWKPNFAVVRHMDNSSIIDITIDVADLDTSTTRVFRRTLERLSDFGTMYLNRRPKLKNWWL